MLMCIWSSTKTSEVLMIGYCTNRIASTKEAKHEAAKLLAERGTKEMLSKQAQTSTGGKSERVGGKRTNH